MENKESLPLISVIVPVYNVEKYLGKCIESIMAQTYQNLEIILVDDGSADKSGEICDEYARRDLRIRVIHNENGGVSVARNTGIRQAAGEYIGLVDSDDYIDPDMYQTLYDLILKHDAQISMCDVYEVYEGSDPLQREDIRDFCVDSEGAVKIVVDGLVNCAYSVNKLYKKELFDGLEFPQGKIFEDARIMPYLLSKAERIALTTARKYYYYHRENSHMSVSFSPKHLDCIEVQEENYKFICEKYPSLEKNARMRLYWSRFFVLDKMLLSGDASRDEYMPYVRYIRKGAPFIVFESILSKQRKLACIVLLFSVSAYKSLLLKSEGKKKNHR